MKPQTRRVRPLLLVLLWIWAGCVALVLDLFRNVPEFDGVRPRAPRYVAMRRTAHEMVGAPSLDETATPLRTPATPGAEASPTRSGEAVARPGGRPDATTPLGRRLLSNLTATAAGAPDVAARRTAVLRLAGMFGADARDALIGIVEDPAQDREVRDLAARLLEHATAGPAR